MGIRIVPSYPSRWYLRSNTATALLSLAIAIYYGVFEFVLTNSNDQSGTDFLLAVIAMAHALYGLTLFFVLAIHHPKTAGFLSYILFFLMAAYSFWLTKDASNTYFAVLVVAGLMSGLYGWLLAGIVNTVVLILLILIQSGNVSGSDDFAILQIVIYAVVAAMSLLIWSSVEQEDESDEPVLKKIKTKRAKKTKNGPVLSTDILINSITDGVAIVNTEGIIETWNPSAKLITGWEESEAVGLDHRSVLLLSDQKDVPYTDSQNPITQSLATSESQKDPDAKLQTRSKKAIEVDLLASTVHDGDKVTASVVIFRDVSQQRSEERQRAEFISTASHEMRTPVAAIEGYLALAMNAKVSKIDSTAKGYLEKAHTSTQHLGKLFQDLLTAAKSEDGRLTNNPEVVEVGQLLDELIEGVRFTAEKKGLLMEGEFGELSKDGKPQTLNGAIRPLVYVNVDPERVREVITNLFDNAVKYTDEGKISIGMHTEDKTVTIHVKDTGAGIPKEDIPHLFQKFYRVDNSATRQVGGTGLGLFISRKIISLYNGKVWVESDVGEGSTFFISLPRLSNDQAQEMMRNESQKNALRSKSAPKKTTPAPVATPAPAATTAPAATVPAAQTPVAPTQPAAPTQPVAATATLKTPAAIQAPAQPAAPATPDPTTATANTAPAPTKPAPAPAAPVATPTPAAPQATDAATKAAQSAREAAEKAL